MFGMSKPSAPSRAKDANARPAPAKKAPRVAVSVQLSPAQRDKLARLGGSTWLRERIDAAPDEPA